MLLHTQLLNAAYIVVLFFSLYCARTSSIVGALPCFVVFIHLRGRTRLTLVVREARGSSREHAEHVHDSVRREAGRIEDEKDMVGSTTRSNGGGAPIC